MPSTLPTDPRSTSCLRRTYLLNKAREDYLWRLAIIEVARVLAVPMLAITDIDSSSSDEGPAHVPMHHPQGTGGLIPNVPPKAYPSVPRFYDISGDNMATSGQGYAIQPTAAVFIPPWETTPSTTASNNTPIAKAVPKSMIQPKPSPPPLPANIRVPQPQAKAAGVSTTAVEDTDFEC